MLSTQWVLLAGFNMDLLLAHDLSFLSDSECQRLEEQVIDVKRMLTSLIEKLTADRSARPAEGIPGRAF
jgi:hypothetical protein